MKRLALTIFLLQAALAGAAYKCIDEKGFTQIGDTPPAGCASVVIYEITSSGKVLRRIDPTPTPEQLKQREEDAVKAKALAEQKRKDQVLLATFSSEREFDVVRDRNVEPLKGRIVSAKERIAAVDKREQALLDEMEFYKAGKSSKAGAKQKEVPHSLTAELERLRSERETLKRAIVGHEKEIEEMRARYDTDKKRWIALRFPGRAAADPPAAAKTY